MQHLGLTSQSVRPWKLHFYLVEIKSLALSSQVSFKQVRSANVVADALAKEGVDWEMPFVATIQFFSLVCLVGYNAFIPSTFSLVLYRMSTPCLVLNIITSYLSKKLINK